MMICKKKIKAARRHEQILYISKSLKFDLKYSNYKLIAESCYS